MTDEQRKRDEQRFWDFFREEHDSVDSLKLQVSALKSVMLRMFQEMQSLQMLLFEKQIVAPDEFNQKMKDVMLSDHSSAGPSPWQSHSYFTYLLSEDSYLRTVVGLNAQELNEFQENRETAKRLT
jgi:hypothetical protein